MGLLADSLRFARLGGSEQRVLGEALAELAACSFMIARRPFARAIAFGSIPLARRTCDAAAAAGLAERCAGTVAALGRRVPWKALCFQQGLALQRMLRRRGVDAQLHYGIGARTGGKLEAHVWIAANGQVILGGDEAANFREVAVFPGKGQ